jgi:hypothetical protein
MTPLAFLLWGAFERATGLGIEGLRLFNAFLGAVVLAMVGLRREAPRWRGMMSAMGLLVFPYMVPLSTHIYTDIVATFFVVLGFALQLRQRWLASAISFALAVSTRQYMVAFPIAVAASLAWPWLRERRLPSWPAWASFLGAAALAGWYLVYGGIAPAEGLEAWPRHRGFQLHPSHALYFLCCVGFYFVLPEAILGRRWSDLTTVTSVGAALSAVLLALFLLVPPVFPDGIGGAFNRALHGLDLAEGVRATLTFVLALGTCLRFQRGGLGAWLVAIVALTMLSTHAPWEKYYLPLIATLWLLSSARALDANAYGSNPEPVPLRGRAYPPPCGELTSGSRITAAV